MTAEQVPGQPQQQRQPSHDPQLTLAGVSRDGARLLLVSRSGQEFELRIDARLSAALRGDSSRLGQLEIEMDSTLRPRDIQARIRAGETPDAVAKAAQTTIDKIMPYAAPVLAEREHITLRAQRSSLRRPGSTPARTLGDAVGTHLRGLNVDPTVVVWDAWRREDGRWTLTAKFSVTGRKGTAAFTFDAPGNFVVLEDDHAQWLVGDTPAPEPEPARTATDPRRGLSAVPSPSLARGPRRASAPVSEDLDYDQPVEAFLDESRPTPDQVDEVTAETEAEIAPEAAEDLQAAAEPMAQPDPEPEVQPLDEQPAPEDGDVPVRRPIRKKGGRASVPTWDEIMFGGGKQE